jgi:predicted metal-binding membrane protein
MRSDLLTNSTDTRRIYLILGFLIVLAWSLLAFWQRSAYAELLGHEAIEDHHISLAWHLAAFILSWFLMTVAMMLPGSLPMILHSIPPVPRRMNNNRLVGWIMLGYLAPWILFGLLVFLGDSFLHQVTEPAAPLAALSGWIAPVIVLIAGLYQFTPVKRRYMARCRTPDALNLQRDGEKLTEAAALKGGLRLGGFCIGSCWMLMLLMFALGQHRLDWMMVLCGILAAERLAPWGHRLARLVGFGLVVWAIFFALTPLLQPALTG